MNADDHRPELFPEVNAAGALRAGFSKRARSGNAALHTVGDFSPASMAGRQSYDLQGEIARGGMGVILKARDRELGRDVALKVLRDELSGEPKLVQRFLEEARVTARLDHPGIVPVHEVGRDAEGRPFFAMRLVRGRELKRIIELAQAGSEGWSQTRALSVIQKVCEAMAYAHDKGVIHRDLKPSNVMVGEFGEVYVMDWGLARLVGGDDTHDLRLRETTSVSARSRRSGGRDGGHDASASPDIESPIVTMDGEVLGTPCYMAPEQAQGRIAELGPRSDVYAVGAMLYHLLAGEMPYVPAGSSVGSRKVLLSLVQGPPRPLHELCTDIPSELIAICDKAMARDPEGRYPDMLAMAEDLRAFLERRVVRAYETGAWAEARKWVQRNKALSAALSIALLTLVAGLLVSLALKAQSDANFVRAENSARAASDERDRALKIASFLEDTLHGVAPSVALGRDTAMLREMMDASWTRIEKGELAAAPEAELRLMLVIGETYDDIAQYEEAQRVLEKTLAKAESLHAGDDPLRARAESQLGEVLRERGDLVRAESLSRAGVEMHRRLVAGDDIDTAESLSKLAALLSDKADLSAAAAVAREALEMRERLIPGDHPSTAHAANNLGHTLHALGDLSGAETYLRRAVAMQERLYHGDHPSLATSIDNLGALRADRGDPRESLELAQRALEMRRRLFPGDHPLLAMSLNNVATALMDSGNSAQAEPLMREALEMRRRLFKEDNLAVATSLTNLAGLLLVRGDLAAAEPLYREALEMLHRLLPGDHPLTASVLGNLGVLLKRRGDFEEAEGFYQDELAMERRLYTGDHLDIARTLNNIASLREVRGDLEGAEPLFREALEMQLRLTPGDNSAVAKYTTNLSNLLQRKGDVAGAELAQRELLRIYRATLPATDARIPAAARVLAGLVGQKARYSEADALYLDAATVLGKDRAAHAAEYAECLREAVANARAWAAADPSSGGAERVSEWKRKLSEAEHE